MNMKEIFRANNFNIIRLIAALQVVIHHSTHYLGVDKSSVAFNFLYYFPGVPIFFFVSGFLISKSYESNSSLIEYTQNRVLRIFPALVVCTFVAIISVYATGYLSGKNVSIGQLLIWIASQVSFAQFYTPEFMRAYGMGVLNSSLWTITVELQFYIMIPVLYWIFGLKPNNSNLKLVYLILFFMLFHLARYYLIDDYNENVLFKLSGVTFFPWIYMFLVGVFFQKNFLFFHRLLSGKALFILPFYIGCAYLSVDYFGWQKGNESIPLLYLFLAIQVFSFAYSYPSFSRNILGGNDISYGVYIYHMPIVNVFVYYGYTSDPTYVLLAIMATILMAIISWKIVEKRSMKLKKHPLNPLNSSS